jgi:hypothetical protein
MARDYYDRYGQFKLNNQYAYMPFIKLRNKNTDIKVVYNKNKRLDRLSNEYYDSPYYGWLILLANPKYGGMEFDIPEDSVIRIPFPLMDTLREYQQKVDQYILENGNE